MGKALERFQFTYTCCRHFQRFILLQPKCESFVWTAFSESKLFYSSGLFHRAIIQSGSALSPWAIQPDPDREAHEIGQLAGYKGEDLEGLVLHLKDRTGEELTKLAYQCKENVKKVNRISCLSRPVRIVLSDILLFLDVF